MGAVGDEDLGPLLAAVAEVGRGDQQGRQLALRPGRRLQADGVQAGDLGQRSPAARSRIASMPWSVLSSWYGCWAARPGRAASRSFRLGLYFIVHDPSG